MTSAARDSAAARSNGDVPPQAGAARAAASTARRASDRPPSASVPMTAPVAGFVAWKVPPPAAAIQRPSMYSVGAPAAVALAVGVPAEAPEGAADELAAVLEGTGAPARNVVGLLHPRRPDLRAPGQSPPRAASSQLASGRRAGHRRGIRRGARWAPLRRTDLSLAATATPRESPRGWRRGRRPASAGTAGPRCIAARPRRRARRGTRWTSSW